MSFRWMSVALAGVTVAAAVSGLSVFGQSSKPPAATSDAKPAHEENKWMEVKLHASQEIFAAMTRGDSKAIETNARRMLIVNLLEQWRTSKPHMDKSDYDAQLNAFEFATKELIRTGREKDISGSLEAYQRLSASCVKCHQAIRDAAPAK